MSAGIARKQSQYRDKFDSRVVYDKFDSRVVCEALPEKWCNEVRHKCSCQHFFSKAQCQHVVVLAMLADPTKVLLPNKSDLKQIRSRAGKKRGRPAGDIGSDSAEEKRKKPKDKRADKEPMLQCALLSDSDHEV